MRLPATIIVSTVLAALAPAAHAGRFQPAEGNGIEGEYLVMLDDRPGKLAESEYRSLIGGIAALYGGRLEGLGCSKTLGIFTVRMTEDRVRRLAEDPRIRVVEQNRAVPDLEPALVTGEEACDPSLPAPTQGNGGNLCTGSDPQIDCNILDPRDDDYDCQDNWGLDRMDQRHLPRSCTYSPIRNGSGVHVYMLDTGIAADHDDFANRVEAGINSITDPVSTEDLDDCSGAGHGTHVSGIIGGTRYGVAKGVTFHPVKFLGPCPEQVENDTIKTIEAMCRGLAWIYDTHGTGKQTGPAVVNFSGGNADDYAESSILREAVYGLIHDKNISFVQSAGNHETDACDESFTGPGLSGQPQLPEVIVVGGVDIAEHNGQEVTGRWRREGPTTTGATGFDLDPSYSSYCFSTLLDCGSNTGSCVDIWAPAGHIVSADSNDVDGGCRQSGTSMAAPHVTGAVALYLQKHPTATPAEVKEAILAAGEPSVLDDDSQSDYYIGSGSPNLLARAGTSILNDDFETGDTSRWDSEFTPNPGDLEVTQTSPPEGSYALEITPEDPGTGQPHLLVADYSPYQEAVFGASFLIDLRFFDLGSSTVSVLYLFDDQGNGVGLLRMRLHSSGYQFKLGTWDDNGVLQQVPQTGWGNLGTTLTWHTVRISWGAATNSSSADGYLALWLDGQVVGERKDIDNDDKSVGEVWFGLTGGGPLTDASGSYHLDFFRSYEGK